MSIVFDSGEFRVKKASGHGSKLHIVVRTTSQMNRENPLVNCPMVWYIAGHQTELLIGACIDK